MTEMQNTPGETLFQEYLRGRITRGQLFKAVGAGLVLASLPGIAAAEGGPGSGSATSMTFPYFPQVSGTYTTEEVQDIVNVAITMEHLAVTVLTSALTTYAGQLNLDAFGTMLVQSALVRDQAHLDFLASVGGKPLTTTFTIPPFIFQNPVVFLTGAEAIETLETGGYMTAAREFAELGQPTLAKNAYQIGAVEAESRALARAALLLLGIPTANPPGNKAFETDLLLFVRDELAIITAFGFINGTSPPMSYPGRDTALSVASSIAASIMQKRPNNASSTIAFTGLGSLVSERL